MELMKIFRTFALANQQGAIAQLVEQRTENPCVPGSIPGGTTANKCKCYHCNQWSKGLDVKISGLVSPVRFLVAPLLISASVTIVISGAKDWTLKYPALCPRFDSWWHHLSKRNMLSDIFDLQHFGAIAQLVEQRTENPCVPGSIPGGTTTKRGLS